MQKTIFISIFFIAFLFSSCRNATNQMVQEEENPISDIIEEEIITESEEKSFGEEKDTLPDTNIHPSHTVEFLQTLEKGANLSAFFSDGWTFVYHAYFRGDGTTKGEVTQLKKEQIDGIIEVKVETDGEGWFEKLPPSTNILKFSLKKEVIEWDRFEITTDTEKNTIIEGGGLSDYLILYYDDKNLINKMEYHSEDPG